MKTYRITEKEIEGKPVLAVGYKIFKNDWTSAQGKYDYKDEEGEVVGTIHKAEGDIKECRWGLHFSKKPQDCFNFYECVQWNKFAKVEAYEKSLDSNDGKKSIAQVLKIVDTYTFNEFIRLIQNELLSDHGLNNSDGVDNSDGVNNSKGVDNSDGVNNSKGVNSSYGIIKCEGISRSIFCYETSGKLMLFNRKITESRFKEIYNKIISFKWFPRFNNAEELKGEAEWYETNIPAIVSVPNEIAWSYMPKLMKEYIQSLPEYNEEIFIKITGKI